MISQVATAVILTCMITIGEIADSSLPKCEEWNGLVCMEFGIYRVVYEVYRPSQCVKRLEFIVPGSLRTASSIREVGYRILVLVRGVYDVYRLHM